LYEEEKRKQMRCPLLFRFFSKLLDQLRGMVKGSHFYATPGKQRWAERWLWRREHAIEDWYKIIGVVIGLGTLIVAAVGLYLRG
jgi:hypothetical protein